MERDNRSRLVLLQTLRTRDFDELAAAFPRWNLEAKRPGAPHSEVPGRCGSIPPSNGFGVFLRRVHEALSLQVAIPNAGESLDVPRFGRADVDFAILADEHCLAVVEDLILLDADGLPLSHLTIAQRRMHP
jgi:hypothetical protein